MPDVSSIGAFGLGLVIGWLVYFTNRYRKGEVQFSDITSMLGVIGGGASTALFDKSGALLGAYGIGLFFGFFLYFALLLWMVANSGGDFTWTWFLDGRRKKPVDPWEIQPGTREQGAAMDVGPALAERLERLDGALASLAPPPSDFATALATAAPSPLAQAADEKSDGIATTRQAIIDIGEIINSTSDDAKRTELRHQSELLSEKLTELVALRLRDRIDNADTQAALTKLRGITGDLKTEAAKMKQVADTLAVAAKVIGQVTKLIGFLGGAFA